MMGRCSYCIKRQISPGSREVPIWEAFGVAADSKHLLELVGDAGVQIPQPYAKELLGWETAGHLHDRWQPQRALPDYRKVKPGSRFFWLRNTENPHKH
jgi:hypothetical protein